MGRHLGLVAVLLLPAAGALPGMDQGPTSPLPGGDPAPATSSSAASEYYAFPLVPTGSVTGTGSARGEVQVNFGTSPFGVSVSADGSYRYDVRVEVRNLPDRSGGEFVAWVAKNDLEEIRRIGPLNDAGIASGIVDWNKFIVVVTLESTVEEDPQRWSGPVVMRGLSRSGLMHSKIGHGPFQESICLALDYGACRAVGR